MVAFPTLFTSEKKMLDEYRRRMEELVKNVKMEKSYWFSEEEMNKWKKCQGIQTLTTFLIVKKE